MLKASALSLGKKAVMEKIAAQIPFLASKFLSPLTALIVGKVLEMAIFQTEMAALFLFIDLRGNEQAKDFEKYAMEYHNAKSEDEKRNIETKLLDSARTLISFKS